MQIEANGIRTGYELAGPAHAPVVVLSHSLGSSRLMWEPQVPALASRYRVLRYDIRGHGETDAPDGPYTLGLLADDAVALLDALEIDRVHFVGLSMGGMVGQALALQHRDRLESLVLCDTMAEVPEEAQPVWRERIETARAQGMGPLAEPTMERWFTPACHDAHPELIAPIRAQFLKTPAVGYIGCCEAIRRLDYLKDLGGVRIPAHVIVGEHDPATPPSAAEAIHRALPGAGLTVIPAAAHLSNLERSGPFNEALLGFLAEL